MFDRFWFCLCLWRLVGVFADSDAVKSVSVMEGDSVSLQTNTKLLAEDLITWTFGLSEIHIAQIIKEAGIFSTYDGPDGRFRDRLKLDHQTGSLTITNTRTTHSGIYQVTISGRKEKTYRFNVTVSVVFADSDAVKSVSVMEGDSVSLQTNTELQKENLITWTFGLSETRIAEINKETGRFSTYDVLDGRFRDRLKVDHQTGSLTITNTRTTHSGLYQIILIRSRKSTYRFNVTVYNSVRGCDTTGAVIRLVVTALVGVAAAAAVVVLVYDIRSRRDEQNF
uniref:Immunoglobulin domain-containing protein n=1 Tax=Cyprinus carpio TaxID=7962 RepID=A0A8C1TGF1_CYPCA